MTHATADIVALADDGSPVLLNQGGLGVDPAGRPHAVFRVVRGGARHLWWDGRSWRTKPLSGLGNVSGRPAVVGDGRDPLLVMWARARAGGRSDLTVARLCGGRTSNRRSLMLLPVADWEPTFDSTALVEQRRLRVLVPVRRLPSPPGAGEAAIGTWSLPGQG